MAGNFVSQVDRVARALFDARSATPSPLTDDEWAGWKERRPAVVTRLFEEARLIVEDEL